MTPRLILIAVVFFALGIFMEGLLPRSWHPGWLLIPVCLSSLVVWRRMRIGLILTSLTIGAFMGSVHEWKNQPSLDAWVSQPVTLRGRVVTDPTPPRMVVQITHLFYQGTWRQVEDQMIVTIKPLTESTNPNTKGENATDQPATKGTLSPTSTKQDAISSQPKPPSYVPAYGDMLELQTVQLEKLQAARNPGGFDALTYYGRQGIHYAVTVKADQLKLQGHDDRGVRGRLFYPLRHRLLEVIHLLYKPEHVALVSGIVLGVVDGMDPEVKETFRVLGVIHILAVSGANVSLLIMPLLALLKKGGLATTKRYSLAILLILLYGGVAGGGASVTRACTMCILWCASRLLARQADSLTSWGFAAGVLLILDPMQLYDIGFQLTFLLTWALLVLPPHLERFLHFLKKQFRKQDSLHQATPTTVPPRIRKFLHSLGQASLLTLIAELLSTPLILTISPVYTPLSLLANLYILPLIAIITPAAVLSILLGLLHPALATIPTLIVSVSLELLVEPLTYVGRAGWWVKHFAAPSSAWLWMYYGGWVQLVLRRFHSGEPYATLYSRLRTFSLTALAGGLLLSAIWRSVAPQNLRVTFLDVGQGDAALIEMPHHHVWLVDGGGVPGFQHSTYDVGARVVVPALAAKGIDDIDVLVMTHADEDHVRGLAAVLQQVHVHNLLVSDLTTDKPFYQSLLQEARRQGIPITLAQVGQTWSPEKNLAVSILNPPVNSFQNTRSDTNSNCVVFSLTYGVRTFLFTGDFEGDQEDRLPIPPQPVDVLKVAHHGSGHSTTLPFLQKTTPTHAILSVGAHNHYGHPAPATVARLQSAGATLWRTDQQGAIVCETDGKKLDIYSWLWREH